MCARECWGRGVLWKWRRTRAGWWPWTWSKWGQQEETEVSGKALPTWAVTLFRELLISNGTHLGNRHLFVDLQGSPGSSPALQWNIWKALAPPHARAAEPWRQRSMTSSWLLLNPCPRQAFFWEPVSNADLWCQGLWAALGRLSLLLKGREQRKGLCRESNEDLAFQEIRAQAGSPASCSLVFWLRKQQAELLPDVNAPSSWGWYYGWGWAWGWRLIWFWPPQAILGPPGR